MIETAVGLVQQKGIATGLESIAFDEVIRGAGVSRTSAYRRWPTRERFYGDVLIELARGTALPLPTMSVIEAAATSIRSNAEHLTSPHAHRDLVVNLLRTAIQADYDLISTSSEWRTYRILLASYEGIADDDVRTGVVGALAASERRAMDARARVYAEFTALLGYRLVPPLAGPDGFEFMSRAAGASMRGVLGIGALGDATLNSPRAMRPFGTSTATEWTPAIYMVAATVLSYIEPDPGIIWDRQRIDDLLSAVSHFRL